MTHLVDSLNRTLLLMRDEMGPEVDDRVLLDALTSTTVALITDTANIGSHAAQTAYITIALLMARSGHKVFLIAPNVQIVGAQPPLSAGRLIDELIRVGKNLLPGIEFVKGRPEKQIDISIALGDTPTMIPARRHIWLNAEAWIGSVTSKKPAQPWQANISPFGALAAAGLGAGEAFKVAMQKLAPWALNIDNTAARFAYTDEVQFELAPPSTPFCRNLGEIDFVSGGAITHAVLFCLARIPAVTAIGRIIEPDISELTNLNRYMLLLRSALQKSKAHDLIEMLPKGLLFKAVEQRYQPETAKNIVPFSPIVIVGVDHIPTRWEVQRTMPEFLAIGATTHWSAMASFHTVGLGCAYCLHNVDDPGDGPIPTVAHVSFWAGLLAATTVTRHAAGMAIPAYEQQTYLSPFRAENPFRAPVGLRSDCPICHASRQNALGLAS